MHTVILQLGVVLVYTRDWMFKDILRMQKYIP